MRIAIMGAGGIGGYVGARLAAAGADVAFIARGAHLAAMQADGLRIESDFGNAHLDRVTATDDPRAIGPVDIVLFCVKLWDTDASAAALAPLVGNETRVVTVQNGIDAVDLVSRHVPREQVAAGVIYIPALITRPGVIQQMGAQKTLFVDAVRGGAATAALKAVADRAVGFDVALSDAIDEAVWEKFVRVSAISAATALMRTTIGPILANPESRAFIRQLLDEGVAVAGASGNPVRPGFAEETMSFYGGFQPAQRASMANDLDAGRRLELPWLSGRMHRLGIEHRVATPAHTAAYRGLVIYADGRPG